MPFAKSFAFIDIVSLKLLLSTAISPLVLYFFPVDVILLNLFILYWYDDITIVDDNFIGIVICLFT